MGVAYSKIEKPCLSLLGLGVIAIYIPGVTGASIPSGWLWLMFILPALLIYYKAEIKLEHKLGFIFLLIAALSLLWTTRFNIGFFYYLQIVALGIAFYIGSCLKDLKPVFKGLAVGLGINAVIGIAQYFGWYGYIYTNPNEVAATFVNGNIFCEISVVILIALVVFDLYWWIPVTIPGIILYSSRAGLLALFVCGLIYFYGKSKRITLLFISLFSIFIIVYYFYGIHNFKLSSVNERFEVWRDTLRGLTLFGNGIGSYETLYPSHAIEINTIVQRPKYAHNDILNLVYELGIFSLILVPFFWNILILKCKENLVLYAIIIISMATYPFHTPYSSFIWFIVAGYIVGNNGAYEPFRLCRRLELFTRFKMVKC